MKRLLFTPVFLFLLFSTSVSAQTLNVSDSTAAAAWVYKLLGATCYNVSGITATGNLKSRGFFQHGMNSIAIDSGLVLSTGDINLLPGPNTTTKAYGGFGDNGAQDADLADLTPGNQFDVAIIEFNIVPVTNSLQFNYVFGSEDYCEHTSPGPLLNVFGIFVSGPGITGVKNIALTPGTGLPVNPITINHMLWSNYYVNNNAFSNCGGLPPANLAACQLDGWTKVLTAQTTVIPCFSYHVKIALADLGSDQSLTAVFLKPWNASTTVPATVETIYPPSQFVAYEGCHKESKFRIKRTDTDITQPLQVSFTLSGTATNMVDYFMLATSPVSIPVGQSFIDVPVKVIQDGINDPGETIIMTLANACTCAKATLTTSEYPAINISLPGASITQGGTVSLSPSVTGGVPAYSYSWNVVTSNSSILTGDPGVYTVTVSDACDLTAVAAATVTTTDTVAPPASIAVMYPPGQSVAYEGCGIQSRIRITRTGSDNSQPLPVAFTVTGNATPGLDYTLSAGTPAIIPAGQSFTDIVVNVLKDTLNDSGEKIHFSLANNASATLVIYDRPALSLLLNGANIVATGSIQLTPEVGGGIPPYQYLWSTNETTPSILATPGVYLLTVTDACGLTAFAFATVTGIPLTPAENCSGTSTWCSYLNNYTGSTAGYMPDNAVGFCGTVENDQWFGFVAGASTATLTVTPSECATGNGVQIALYSDCNAQPIPNGCNGGCVGCGNEPLSLSVTLISGNTYSLQVDGYAGDECNFKIDVSPVIAVQPPTLGIAGNLTGPSTVCPGATLTYSIPPISGADTYTWTAPPGWLINGNPPPFTTHPPNGNQVIIFAGQGLGTTNLCVNASNTCNPDGITKCKTIQVATIPATNLPKKVVCAENAPYVLPWGDETYTSGTYSHTYSSYQGCDSVVVQLVTIKPPIITNLGNKVLCAGECLTICGAQYCAGGNYAHVCTSYQGCDSIVNFSILSLDPKAQIIGGGQLSCAVKTILLQSVATQGTRLWKDLQGQTLATSATYTVTAPGTYILFVQASAGGVLCSKSDTIDISAAPDFITVQATGGTLGCSIDSVFQLSATTNSLNALFLWAGPGGFTSTAQNPVASMPGIYSVTVTDIASGCMVSTTTQLTQDLSIPVFQTQNVVQPVTGNNNGSIHLTVMGTPPFTFTWYLNGQLFSNSENLDNLAPGTYVCVVTGGNGCSVSQTFILMFVSATVEPGNDAPWTIHPNPGTGQFVLCCNHTGAQSGQIWVHDCRGLLVWTRKMPDFGTDIPVDLTELPAGLYFLEIRDTKSSAWMKVLIQR
jgi:hypothetical protein